MCGIFAATRSADWKPHIEDVLSALGNRGPDQAGVTDLLPDVLRAHTRLEIIGHRRWRRPPATSEDGSICVTYNGEIYNYRALAASRALSGNRSDTRVLAELGSAAQLRASQAFDRRRVTNISFNTYRSIDARQDTQRPLARWFRNRVPA
jgi:asparagine synthetase B (glutamine-hydrolysing)